MALNTSFEFLPLICRRVADETDFCHAITRVTTCLVRINNFNQNAVSLLHKVSNYNSACPAGVTHDIDCITLKYVYRAYI